MKRISAGARRAAMLFVLAIPAAAIFGLAVISGLAGAAKAEDTKKPPGSWHTTAFVRGSMGIRVIDYWARGDDMVARTLINGRPITTIVYGGRYIVFDGLDGVGLDVGRSKVSMKEDRDRDRPFGFELEDLKSEGGEKIDDVSIGSMRGEIWQVRDARGRRKLWVSKGVPEVPLRLETFDRASGETIELDYQNWVFDIVLPDRFFVPPSGVKLTRIEYEAYLDQSGKANMVPVPVLYPDLLHGVRPD